MTLTARSSRRAWLRRWRGAGCLLALGAIAAGCGSGPATPSTTQQQTQTTTPTTTLLPASFVTDALDYMTSSIGTTYQLLPADALPRLLMRSGDDGLANGVLGRGGIDGFFAGPSNQAQSGIVVINPGLAQTCPLSPDPINCRGTFRHEVGHALGFLNHTTDSLGLMNAIAGQIDTLSADEQAMMTALYALPIGAQLQSDGSWSVAATGASGKIADPHVAQNVIDHNITPCGRTPGVICRWATPVPVYFQR